MVSRLPRPLILRRLLTSLCHGDSPTIQFGSSSWQRIPRLTSVEISGLLLLKSSAQSLLGHRAVVLSSRHPSPAAAAIKQTNVENDSNRAESEGDVGVYDCTCCSGNVSLPLRNDVVSKRIFTWADDMSYYSRCVVVGTKGISELSGFTKSERELLTFMQFSPQNTEILNMAADRGDESKVARSGEGDGGKPKLPNIDRLNAVKDFLVDQIPGVLSKQHEYRVYTKDVVFENNWNINKPVVVVGQVAYALALLKARFYVHSKYAKVKVTVLAASVDEGAGCVAVQWRLSGLPQLKAFMFWKYVPFRVKSKAREESVWLEGLSTFYINSDGFIYKHKLDRVIPDKGPEVDVKLKDIRLGLQGT